MTHTIRELSTLIGVSVADALDLVTSPAIGCRRVWLNERDYDVDHRYGEWDRARLQADIDAHWEYDLTPDVICELTDKQLAALTGEPEAKQQAEHERTAAA